MKFMISSNSIFNKTSVLMHKSQLLNYTVNNNTIQYVKYI